MTELLRVAGFVTDFADQAVILPLAAVVAVALYGSGWRRGALIWSSVIVATLGFMFILKIGFGACGHLIPGGQIESPSGHTAAAGVLYGSIFAFLAERLFGRNLLTLAAILITVVVVGVSRVVLGAHTVLEVFIGAAVGGVAAWLMVKGAGTRGERRLALSSCYRSAPSCFCFTVSICQPRPPSETMPTASHCRSVADALSRTSSTVRRAVTTSFPRHGLLI